MSALIPELAIRGRKRNVLQWKSCVSGTQKVLSSKNDLITKVHAPAERATQAKHVGAEKVQLFIPLLIISIRFRLPPEHNFLLAVVLQQANIPVTYN